MSDSVFLNSEILLNDVKNGLILTDNPKPFFKDDSNINIYIILLFLLIIGIVFMILYIYK